MDLAATAQAPVRIPTGAPHSKALMMHCLPDSLSPALRTPENLALLNTYFLIPQPSVRRFVLMLLARITSDGNTAYPVGDRLEAEYLLTQYAQLPTGDMQDKMLALVRQICAANRGDKSGAYEATQLRTIFGST